MFQDYKSREFSYSIREVEYGDKTRYLISVTIGCYGVAYMLYEKMNSPFPCYDKNQAKKRIMKVLRNKCEGTFAEEKMKKLPIFQEEGYMGDLFNQ